MKSFKIIISVVAFILTTAIGVLIGLTVWANKPRGVKIDLAKLDSIY